MRRTQQQLNERPRGIIPEYFRNTSRAQERPGVSRGSFPDWAVALQLCNTGLQHRAALLCLNGTTLRAMPCSWPAWRVEGGGLAQPSLSTQRNEQRNCCVYCTFHNYGTIYTCKTNGIRAAVFRIIGNCCGLLKKAMKLIVFIAIFGFLTNSRNRHPSAAKRGHVIDCCVYHHFGDFLVWPPFVFTFLGGVFRTCSYRNILEFTWFYIFL